MKMSHTLVFVHHSSCSLRTPCDPSNFLKCGVWFSLLLAQGLVVVQSQPCGWVGAFSLTLTGMQGDSLKDATINTPEDGAWGSSGGGTGTVAPAEAGSPLPTSPVPELYPYRNRRSVSHASKLIEPEGRGPENLSSPGDNSGPVSGVEWGLPGDSLGRWCQGSWILGYTYLLVWQSPSQHTLGSKSQCRC